MAILNYKDRRQELLYLNIWPRNSKKTKQNKKIQKQIGSELIEDTYTILEISYESLKLRTSRSK